MKEQEMKTLIERIKSELIPVGSIMCYASSRCPEGYLPCDGRELMQSQYPDLYKVIGKLFGGSLKTFCLPDLQGRFIRGWDEEGDTDPERAFGSSQDDELQGHSHNAKSSSNGSHKHNVYYSSHKAVTSVGGLGNTESDYSFWEVYGESVSDRARTVESGSHSHDITILEPRSSTFQTVRYGVETRPKNIALLYCIKVK